MPRSLHRAVLALMLLSLALAIRWGEWQRREGQRVRELARIDALAIDSNQAARDSTRAVVVAGAFRDSVRVYQHRIVQVRQRADSLDQSLGLERAARYQIAAEMAELRTRITSPVTVEPDDERSATFSARDGPFYIDAAVTLPRPPGDGQVTLRVRVDTAVLEARVGCGPANGSGVSPAALSLAGPSWMALRLDRLEQEPRVCSPSEPIARAARESFAAWDTARYSRPMAA
jgi:hypothetical protein